MTPWEKDLRALKEKCPRSEEELCETLGISEISPEGYYASLVYIWLTFSKADDDTTPPR